MRFLFRRSFLIFALLALGATACSSSSDGDVSTATETTATETTAEEGGTEEGGADNPDSGDGSVPAPSAIPVPDDDPVAEAAIAALDGEDPPEDLIADPTENATLFVRNRFNIDPDPAAVECIVEQASTDEVLDTALRTPSVGQGNVDDSELKALSFALNGCLDTAGLADWTTQAVGPQGEVRETAPICFTERFDDPDRGDVTFYTIVALTYQFRVEPEGVPDAIDALATCAPITGLADFFANDAEASSNYETVIDRDCFVQEISDPEVSVTFWTTLVEGLVPPVTTVTNYLAGCAVVLDETRADALPDDFVPWSGTGALAGVIPAVRANAYASPPPMTIDTSASYEAVIATGEGEIRVRLLTDTSPITVNNFVNLAQDGFYDGTVFHRVMADFMAQGGDPTGSGAAGPGYTFDDEVEGDPPLERAGLLAMANTGPDSNGSQFFITVAPTDWLTGLHTVFGEVIEGQDIVDAIQLRDPAAPNGRGQLLDSVTIIQS